MTRKTISLILTFLMMLSLFSLSFGTVSADVAELPEVAQGCYRYFFLMPQEWYNQYTDCAGVYWYEGTDACETWPGYKAHKADAEGVYYYDVPKDVETIMWNNYLDGGFSGSEKYDYAFRTPGVSLKSYSGVKYYEMYKDKVYFNGMLFFPDMEDMSGFNSFQHNTFNGDWYYYFGDGEYGTPFDIEVNFIKDLYPDNDYSYMEEIIPYFYPESYADQLVPWSYYDMLYANMDEDTAENEGEYVVFIAHTGACEPASVTERFGDYKVTSSNIEFPYDLGHYVYVPALGKVLTLEEAWEDESLDLAPAFESGSIGRHKADANDDGKLDIKDATYIQKYIAGFEGFRNTGYMNFIESDGVNIKDATAIQKHIAGVVECNRYYFYMPEFMCNEYSDCAGIYWWDGPNIPTQWPGYKAHKADAEGIYYYDVPKDTLAIIWNNNIDGGADQTADIYKAAIQTKNIGTECYDPGESDFYPEGLSTFDGMIYVIDPYYTTSSVFTGRMTFEGEWFYYYGNGEYGTTPTKGDKVFTDETIDMFNPDKYLE
ncbi:MAG: hypothetical protein IJV88_04415 [Ruminococcus sp.]|nr:hypothetical protein [Ruminococcus sp.]